jgi:hypothetical protein
MVITKITSTTSSWGVHHRDLVSANEYMFLNTTSAAASYDTVSFSSTQVDLGTFWSTNFAGETGIAYIFAHNDGDGEFGPDGDADIIKCGSYTGNGSSTGPVIDLGFEPQWLLIKDATSANNWLLFDNMRGLVTGGNDALLRPNLSDAELTSVDLIEATSTGFRIPTNDSGINGSGNTYIYIAIRRGPMAVPTDATDVFAMDVGDGTSSPNFISNFPVDASLLGAKSGSDKWYLASRLTGTEYLRPNLTDAAGSAPRYGDFDMMDAWWDGALPSDYQAWMWRRAPNYFDAVAYTGNGTAGRTVSHNLGVAPEMMWIKQRNTVRNWAVYHSGTGNTKQLELNTSDAAAVDTHWNNTTPTSTEFTLGTNTRVNESAGDYIAYLFASVDGVSKVGSYTGTGSTLNIDCGFSSGARFVLIKRTDANGSWWIHDTERGITTGNDGILRLDGTDAEITSTDQLSPLSSGFTVASTATSDFNASGGTYIFYAIA